MATSIGLAIYFAERNVGAYHNLFMTFSDRPETVILRGETLEQKIRNVNRANWDCNTDLKAAFERVLEIAKKHNTPQEEMPKAIVVMRSVSSLCILPPLSAYSVLLFLCSVPYFSLSMPVGIRRFLILWFCKVLTFLLLFGCRVYTYIVNWVVYGNRVLCHFTIGVVLGFLIFGELRGVSCP